MSSNVETGNYVKVKLQKNVEKSSVECGYSAKCIAAVALGSIALISAVICLTFLEKPSLINKLFDLIKFPASPLATKIFKIVVPVTSGVLAGAMGGTMIVLVCMVCKNGNEIDEDDGGYECENEDDQFDDDIEPVNLTSQYDDEKVEEKDEKIEGEVEGKEVKVKEEEVVVDEKEKVVGEEVKVKEEEVVVDEKEKVVGEEGKVKGKGVVVEVGNVEGKDLSLQEKIEKQ